MNKHRLIIVMGVSGSGKSTIARVLAESLKVKFYDGDDFHPIENIDKMASGKALIDEDRWPWLEAINTFAQNETQKSSIVIACSALKEAYREILAADVDTIFVYLRGSQKQILERLEYRKDHFMPPSLLASQFATLEEPTNALIVDIDRSIDEIVKLLVTKLV